MPSTIKFLLVDDNAENRFFLNKTLLRKFPQALVLECQDSSTAISTAAAEPLTAIVVHRAMDMGAVDLIKGLRKVRPNTPLLMVSGREAYPEALEAGANMFLKYDEWLRVGTVMEQLVGLAPNEPSKPPPSFLTGS